MASREWPFERFDIEETSQSIPARFDRQVRRHGERIAVTLGDDAWSYRQLDARANGVARELLHRRCAAPERVALLGEQGPANVAATLGVLKAGKTYVPLDAEDPPDRLRFVLDDCGAELLIVVNDQLRDLAASLVGAGRVVSFEDTRSADDVRVTIPPDACAYLFYTSGSTGRPKGVADTHRNVLHNVLRYTNNLHISPEDRLTLLQSPSFSGAVSSMFAALLNGGRCCPLNLRNTTSEALANYVLRERITIYHSVPSIFRSFVAFGRYFPDVRLIRLEGDQASRRDVELYRQHFSDDCRLVNGLGATETGISLQYFVDKRTPLPEGHLPVGFCTPDMDVLLLADDGTRVADGVPGEISVRSRYLAPGYWNRPDLTSKAFLDSADGDGTRTYRSGDLGRTRPDGSIEHLGRKDFRVKIRGNTVEIADVEAVLMKMAGVRDAAVAATQDRRGENRLVAYVVANREPGPTLGDVRRAVGASLPGYMQPSALVLMDALPLSANRKVDRRNLPVPDLSRRAVDTRYVAPRNDTEARLAALWIEVLDVETVGVADDFFELGGDSLTAAGLCARTEAAFGRAISVSMLAEMPTIERLAARLDRDTMDLRRTLIPIQRGGDRSPFFAVHGHLGEVLFYRPLAQHLGPDQPFYGLASTGIDLEAMPPYGIETIAAEYVRQIRSVQPSGPYRVGGYCLGGAVAFEMARQLEAEGEKVALVALFDADYPASPPRSLLNERTHVHLNAMATLRWHARVAYTARRSVAAMRLLKRAGAALLWRAAFGITQRLGWTLPRRLRDTSNLNREAWRSYQPGAYEGRIVHFISAGTSPPGPDPRNGWATSAPGSVTTLEVPGTLHTMMQEPYVATLAERLRTCLS